MSKINNRAPKMTALAITLILFANALRLIRSDILFVNTIRSFLIFTIYIGMLAAWGLSIWRRMMHSHIRWYLLSISTLMLFWIFVRTLKWYAFDSYDATERFLWYCYYIPTIFIPLLSFFAALCLGKPENWRPRRGYHLLLIPAVLLILGILTNDLHQKMFAFLPNLEDWSSQYTYRVLFYINSTWAVGFLGATVWMLFKKSYIPHTKKRVWLPLIVVAIGVLYAVMYAVDSSPYGIGFIESTAMYCALGAAIWESCIQTRLLPVNTQYAAFFDSSHIAAQITDDHGHMHYHSKNAEPIPPLLFERLKQKMTIQPNASTFLHIAPIRGGYVVWQEDVTELSQLIEKLRIVGSELKEGVEFLQSEMEVTSKRQRIDEQNRLYELTVRQTMHQLETIKAHLVKTKQTDDTGKRRLLHEINLLGAYIKRRSNLILMAEGKEMIDAPDLSRCFEEAFESLRQGGVHCDLAVSVSGNISHDCAILIYDFFQAVLEAGFSTLRRVLVTLTEEENDLAFLMEMACSEDLSGFPDSYWHREQLTAFGGWVFCHTKGEGDYRFALHLPMGGASL